MKVYCSRCGEQVAHPNALLSHWAVKHPQWLGKQSLDPRDGISLSRHDKCIIVVSKEAIMNPIKLIAMAFTFWSLNKGQSFAAKAVLKEAMDVVSSLGAALKDKRITPAEKVAIVKEIKEFSKAAIKSLDDLIIPE